MAERENQILGENNNVKQEEKSIMNRFLKFVSDKMILFVLALIIVISVLLVWVYIDVNSSDISSNTYIKPIKLAEITNTTNITTNTTGETITNIKSNLTEDHSKARVHYYFLICILLAIATGSYTIHFGIVLRRLINQILKDTELGESMPQKFWYLLVITLGLPVSFSFLPNVTFDPYIFIPNLWSVLLYDFLSSLIMVLLTTELATLFANLNKKKNGRHSAFYL